MSVDTNSLPFTTRLAPAASMHLTDSPMPSLQESLERARRLVSDRVGVISEVLLLERDADDPAVHWAWSSAARRPLYGDQRVMHLGMAASVDRDRAIMKALGESIERYCMGFYRPNDLWYGTYRQLGPDAVHPDRFALFSPRQYATPDFPYAPLDADTALTWVQGLSLTTSRPRFVPATFVYLPFDGMAEPHLWYQISTGVACSHNRASALYKAILECVERDAFMIVWRNRLPCPAIDLAQVDDQLVRRQLRALEAAAVRVQAFSLTLDLPVAVILVVLSSLSDRPPYRMIGMGTDLDPRRALILALEEASLTFRGLNRAMPTRAEYRPAADYSDLTDLELHGLAYACDPNLGRALAFLTEAPPACTLDDLPNRAGARTTANVALLVEALRARDLEVLAFDLTTPDVDEVGFKVMRAVVPGMQHLDISHTQPYLGGRRLYDVPWRLGVRSAPAGEQSLNDDPHPFP